MNELSIVSSSDMPAAKSTAGSGSRPRAARRGRAGGQDEQGDLGRGVEAEPEEAAERVHLPRLA